MRCVSICCVNQNDPSLLADCAASITTASSLELQGILDELNLKERMKLSLAIIKKELEAKLQFRIKGSVSEKLTKRQKDFFLKEQLKEIQSELGIKLDDKSVDAAEFEKRMKKLSAPEHIQKRFKSELQKLNVLESGSPEYAVTRNYLDVLTNYSMGQECQRGHRS